MGRVGGFPVGVVKEGIMEKLTCVARNQPWVDLGEECPREGKGQCKVPESGKSLQSLGTRKQAGTVRKPQYSDQRGGCGEREAGAHHTGPFRGEELGFCSVSSRVVTFYNLLCPRITVLCGGWTEGKGKGGNQEPR